MIIKANFRKTIPLTIRWVIVLWFVYMLIFSLFRLTTVLLFKPANVDFTSLLPSFWMGFRFDAKWIAIILLPIVLLSLYPKFSPFFSERNKRAWFYYLAFITLVVLFFFGADIGNFNYNHTRINASALNFAEDPVISFKMLWQSYPMFWILTGLALTVFGVTKVFRKAHLQTISRNVAGISQSGNGWHFGALLFFLWCIFGIFSLKPLVWEDAFQLNDNFKSYVALNPLQNFFTTLQFRRTSFGQAKAKLYFPVMADFLQLDSVNIADKDYARLVLPDSKALESRPNVVLVICESFSMYKSSMSGNRLNTTPFFKSLCDSGLFFSRCFSPTFGTARGIFGILTGTPDVQLSEFSSRNPEAIKQHTIVNDFLDYQKYYFLGGNSDFNNFEGLVKNIDSLHLYQEGSYKSPSINVWGISDKNLFKEAENVLSQNKEPFFAIIQTADNHRPYTIPETDYDFERKIVPEDTLFKYGFESIKEYQSFCYTDYCFKKFIQQAKVENWFNNTIFVFVGDHGLEGDASAVYPKAWTSGRLTDEHVPLLFYAPELITPQLRKEVVSQIDLLPTLAGMLHLSYLNTTLGRDLLHSKNKTDGAFIIHHDEGNIGFVTDDYYFVKNLRINNEDLWPMNSNTPNLSPAQKDSVKAHLSLLTSAFYETSKWMLVNNKN